MDVAPVKARSARRNPPTRSETKAITQARWREWRRLLDEGVYPTRAALARGEGVSRAAVTKRLRQIGVPRNRNP
jgi:hypothetical protein